MNTSQRYLRGRRSALLGLITNAVLVVIKLAAGFLGHSYALIADGVESTADIFSSLIVWRGLKIASRQPDQRHPFGYGKAESIAAAAVALMLLAAAVGISVQAVREILTPHHSPAPFTLLVLVVVIFTKELLFRYVFTVGSEVRSLAVQTDAWHHRSDAITSTAAFIGISAALLGGPAWAEADDYAAVAASVIIATNGLRFLRLALSDLMDASPGPEVLEAITTAALAVEGVRAIEKVLARRSGTGYRVVLHVQADPDMPLHEAHALGGRVRRRLASSADVVDAVIHMEPYSAKPDRPIDRRESVEAS